MRTTLVMVLAFLLLGVPSATSGNEGTHAVLEDLTSEKASIRQAAKVRLMENRQDLIRCFSHLTYEPRTGAFYSSAALAAELLGEFRAVEAVPRLLDIVDEPFPALVLDGGPLDVYPAAGSLADIGLPALSAIHKTLDEKQPEIKLLLFAWILRFSDGKEVAVKRLNISLENSSGLEQRQLERILAHLEEERWPPVNPGALEDSQATTESAPAKPYREAWKPSSQCEGLDLFGLVSRATPERKKAKERLISSRHNLIKQLLEISADEALQPGAFSPRVVSMDLLGEMRAEEASDFLVEHVELKGPPMAGEPGSLNSYPAARALYKIGVPALREIDRSLDGSEMKSDIELQLFAQIFRLVDGKEVAMHRLQLMIEEAEAGGHKEQLQKLRAFLEEDELPPVDASSLNAAPHSVQGEAKVAYPKTAMVQFPNGLPDGMSLGEGYEILEGDTAKPGSLPTRKLRLEPARETP